MITETSIPTCFPDLEDPQIERNQTHPLIDILTIAVLGVMYGADS